MMHLYYVIFVLSYATSCLVGLNTYQNYRVLYFCSNYKEKRMTLLNQEVGELDFKNFSKKTYFL